MPMALTCPVCGGKPATKREDFRGTILFSVVCTDCGLAGPARFDLNRAILDWDKTIDKRNLVDL